MSRQSSRYLMLIEPATSGYNPETAATNDYQVDARETYDTVHARYIAELRDFRNALIEAGVGITVMRGPVGSPDAGFPNWFSTHDDGTAFLYPMLTPNRARERTREIIDFLKKFYNVKGDYVVAELQGHALESTGSLVLDRVNRIAYIGRSKRTHEPLAREWCAREGYEPVVFDTIDHRGQPVYHTDLIIWIGTDMAGIGAQSIAEPDRDRVLESLSRHREVLEYDNSQIRHFCGNALEVLGQDNAPMLVMSEAAEGMLTSDQLSRIKRYYTKIIAPKIPTIETYGGGSARCLVQQLF